VGQVIQPIIGGTVSGASRDAVVVLARFDAGVRRGMCTATMVAPNLLVTARHCVSETDATAACDASGAPVTGARLHGDRAPSSLAIYPGLGGVAPDTTREYGATARGKALVVDPATTICNRDLAFVVLDRALFSVPYAAVRLAAPDTSAPITAVGFGIVDDGSLPTSRRERSGVALLGAGPMAYPEDARYGIGDAELLAGESACSGDSGSPALAASGAVIGVASRTGNGKPRDPANPASTCLGATAHVVYAQLAAGGASLALRAFAEAGQKPWLEGEPDPRALSSPSANRAARTTIVRERDEAPLPTPPLPIEGPEVHGEGSGCAISGEPTRGAVEEAVGVLAIVLVTLRLTRKKRAPTAP